MKAGRREYSSLYLTSKDKKGNLVSICDETFDSHAPELEGDLRKATALGLCLPPQSCSSPSECPKNILSNDAGEPKRKPPREEPLTFRLADTGQWLHHSESHP